MASQISTEDLVTKVKSFILTNPNEKGLDHMIKESIIKVDRDIRKFDSLHPLAWDIQPYSGLRTVCPANISGITQADPAVFTAASVDTDITGHGFDNHSTITDIVTIDGIVGDEDSNNIEALNGRQFISVCERHDFHAKDFGWSGCVVHFKPHGVFFRGLYLSFRVCFKHYDNPGQCGQSMDIQEDPALPEV